MQLLNVPFTVCYLVNSNKYRNVKYKKSTKTIINNPKHIQLFRGYMIKVGKGNKAGRAKIEET